MTPVSILGQFLEKVPKHRGTTLACKPRILELCSKVGSEAIAKVRKLHVLFMYPVTGYLKFVVCIYIYTYMHTYVYTYIHIYI